MTDIFDFIGFACETGIEIKISPLQENVIIAVREIKTNCSASTCLACRDAGKVGAALEQMHEVIKRKHAVEGIPGRTGEQLREREKFFKGV